MPVRGSRLADLHLAATLIYLALPLVIFLCTWIKPLYGLPAAAAVAAGTVSAMHHLRPATPIAGAGSPGLSWRDLLWACLPVAVLALLSGAGGIGYQDSDWLKHNALLRDLVGTPWPVVYDLESGALVLSYYVAWYLPAAVIGKLAGWTAANLALALYTLFGFFLVGLWVIRTTGAHRWWVVVVFLAFSGMDIVGRILREVREALGGGAFEGFASSWDHIEWWSGPGTFQYSGMTTLAMWVPNQAIAGGLLMALIVAAATRRRLLQTALLLLGISVLWAPFVTLGLLPFVAILAVTGLTPGGGLRSLLRSTCTTANLGGVIAGVLTTTYLAARFAPITLPADVAGLVSAGLTTRLGLRFLIARYLPFVLLEFLLLHALLYGWFARHPSPQILFARRILMVASAVLLGLPLLKYGFNNDLVMRVSIPALFVTMLVTILVLADRKGTQGGADAVLRGAIVAVLVVGSVTSMIELARHARGIYLRGALVAIPVREEVQSLLDLQRQRYATAYNFFGQYVGSTTSPYMTYLAPEVAAGEGANRR